MVIFFSYFTEVEYSDHISGKKICFDLPIALTKLGFLGTKWFSAYYQTFHIFIVTASAIISHFSNFKQ